MLQTYVYHQLPPTDVYFSVIPLSLFM